MHPLGSSGPRQCPAEGLPISAQRVGGGGGTWRSMDQLPIHIPHVLRTANPVRPVSCALLLFDAAGLHPHLQNRKNMDYPGGVDDRGVVPAADADVFAAGEGGVVLRYVTALEMSGDKANFCGSSTKKCKWTYDCLHGKWIEIDE